MILAKKQCDQENVPGKENGILKVPGPSAAHKTTPVQVLLAVPTDRVCREISLPWYLHDSIGIYHGLCTMVFLQISTGHSSFLTCGHHHSTKQIPPLPQGSSARDNHYCPSRSYGATNCELQGTRAVQCPKGERKRMVPSLLCYGLYERSQSRIAWVWYITEFPVFPSIFFP